MVKQRYVFLRECTRIKFLPCAEEKRYSYLGLKQTVHINRMTILIVIELSGLNDCFLLRTSQDKSKII
jgi:hypothetical protein